MKRKTKGFKRKNDADYIYRRELREETHREIIEWYEKKKSDKEKRNRNNSKLEPAFKKKSDPKIKCTCGYEFFLDLGECPKCGENTVSIIRNNKK